MEGHESKQNEQGIENHQVQLGDTKQPNVATNVDDITPEERKSQEAMPRNPKKRMMEVPPGIEENQI